MEKLYIGIDLHSSNVYVGIIDETGKKISGRRLGNNLTGILSFLEKYKDRIANIAVESTFNWYWLVDGLQSHGYPVVLANPGAMRQYDGIKHVDDKSDAFFIAELLRLKILPTGYIYPLELRGIRDLLRRRQMFVTHRTAHFLSIKSALMRHCGITIKRHEIMTLTESGIDALTGSNESLKFILATHLQTVRFLSANIAEIEKYLAGKVQLSKEFNQLLTLPGVGKILGMTIMLETGDIRRFAKVGNYTSYCRCTGSNCSSNGKSKGKNNTKNGNRFLSWALVEAATFAMMHYSEANKFYQRKLAKKNGSVAIKSIAAKLSKAIYFMLKNDQPFDMKRVFG